MERGSQKRASFFIPGATGGEAGLGNPAKGNEGMETLQVQLGERSYPIHIRAGLLEESGALLAGVLRGRRIAVLTDDTVYGLYGARLEASLRAAGHPPQWIRIAPGEESKRIRTLEQVWEALAAGGLQRDDLLVGFGGGVVGDMAGFAAACYMRGIDVVQIPTTLLAQVDSSVGGKTGVDLEAGKNLVGAFWQPRLVLADPSLLATLTPRERAGGLAEVVKYGTIASEGLFLQLESSDVPASLPESIIVQCCHIKRDIVQRDERDGGERMLLNFGHTFGHAIERAGGYRRFTHGEAVSIGMVAAARAGESMGLTDAGTAARLEELLARFGLPTESPYPPADLSPLLHADKKAGGDVLRFILLRRLGEAFVWETKPQEAEAVLAAGVRHG